MSELTSVDVLVPAAVPELGGLIGLRFRWVGGGVTATLAEADGADADTTTGGTTGDDALAAPEEAADGAVAIGGALGSAFSPRGRIATMTMTAPTTTPPMPKTTGSHQRDGLAAGGCATMCDATDA